MRKILSTYYLIVFSVILTCFSYSALARIGVGVGTGKIQVTDKLKAGMIYKLPSLTVVNTGDEPSDYEVAVTYHEQQHELRPLTKWFIFTPQRFHLNAGEVKEVTIKLNLPLRTTPGDYFAYLEASPAKRSETGGTSIGVAAAAKLYFTISPANFLQGIYYKVVSFWKVYSPWPSIVTLALAIIVAIILFKKYFKIELNIKKTAKKEVEEKVESEKNE